nr:hypothetical protein Itr_chr09CG07880 [Ipomoea trifida]GMD30463.1 hypothetical protein Iba_chr09aCG7210 [Ipomoea batatas]GMD35468.1 hypothetical protein Iba_chr09dCG7240 [Ipomoea batatas]
MSSSTVSKLKQRARGGRLVAVCRSRSRLVAGRGAGEARWSRSASARFPDFAASQSPIVGGGRSESVKCGIGIRKLGILSF